MAKVKKIVVQQKYFDVVLGKAALLDSMFDNGDIVITPEMFKKRNKLESLEGKLSPDASDVEDYIEPKE